MCHTRENVNVYTSSPDINGVATDPAWVRVTNVDYGPSGEESNVIPGSLHATVDNIENYTLSFDMKIISLMSAERRNIIHVGNSETHKVPALYFKKGTRYDLIIESQNDDIVRQTEYKNTWKHGDSINIKMVVSSHAKDHKMKIYIDDELIADVFTWSLSDSSKVKIFTSSPWDLPADVAISNISYTDNDKEEEIEDDKGEDVGKE